MPYVHSPLDDVKLWDVTTFIKGGRIPESTDLRAILTPPISGITRAFKSVHPFSTLTCIKNTVTSFPDGSFAVHTKATYTGERIQCDSHHLRVFVCRLCGVLPHVCGDDRDTAPGRWIKCDCDQCTDGCGPQEGWFCVRCCGLSHLSGTQLQTMSWVCPTCDRWRAATVSDE